MRVVDVSSDLFTSHRWNGFLEQLGAQFSPFFHSVQRISFQKTTTKGVARASLDLDGRRFWGGCLFVEFRSTCKRF